MLAVRRGSLHRLLAWLALGATFQLAGLYGIAALAQDAPPAAAMTRLAPASKDAEAILDRIRPAMIQIKVFLGGNSAHSSHGSGFAAKPGGIFLTNYHVVSEVVHNADRYRLEYAAPDGKTGALSILAIDVRNDLAVVQAANHAPEPLEIVSGEPRKGERAFSLGYPLDLGLTITEGVSNGKVVDTFNSRIHYSGALNGGMSGGPAVNDRGEVIGVNVSSRLFNQLVNFLVPADRVRALRDGSPLSPADPVKLKAEVATQLRAHSASLLAALDAPIVTEAVYGYRLPAKLAGFINCSASGDPAPEQPVHRTRIACNANAGIYVEQRFTTGDLHFTHQLAISRKLGDWRFANQLTKLTFAIGYHGNRKNVGPYACENDFVALKGFEASIVTCSRALREFAGLYDFSVRVSSLSDAQKGFASYLDMYGVEFDAGTAFIRRYVQAMERVP